MNIPTKLQSGWRQRLLLLMMISIFSTDQVGLEAAEPSSQADQDWQALVKACEDLPAAKAIRGRRVDGEERLRWRGLLHSNEWFAADLSAAFRSRYPNDPRSLAALKMELEQMIWAADVAVSIDTNLFQRVEQLVGTFAFDSRFSTRERFNLSSAALGRITYARVNGLTNAADFPVLLDLELGDARLLRKWFPDTDSIWDHYQLIAGQLPPEKARPVLQEILQNAPEGSARKKAEGLQWRLEAKGKPLQLKFTTIDGRTVDTREWLGKVIVVDFWATWCSPCVAELPKLREVYDRHHDRGFEIAGISLDMDKRTLENFVKRTKTPWPQHFDGQAWNSEIVVRYGISLIPSLWLIDKKGMLRDLEAREDLATKVEALLKE